MSNKSPRTKLLTWIGVLSLLAPAIAIAGLTAQGLTAQGLTAQGLTAQGLTAQGLTAQGLTAQGLTAQGLTAQGLTAQGLTAQGLTAQGLTAQGLTAQGVSLMGSDIGAAELKGVAIHHIEMRGTVSTDESPHVVELTHIPSMSTGSGNYITVDGRSAVGHYARAHMANGDGTLVTPAETVDLYVAGEAKDPNPNLFHRSSEQDNQDELYTVYFFHKWSGQWVSLCPFDARTRMASAMALPEDPTAPNQFIFACTATGVASKCARNWGYRPWGKTTAWQFDTAADKWIEAPVKLKNYYDACTIAARAGYCQDGQSFTKQGTLIDLFDTSSVIWPNMIENPFNKTNPDSLWMMAQEYFISAIPPTVAGTPRDSALQRTRYRELTPINRCNDTFADILRLEHDHLEDGRWANPSTKQYLQIFSPTSCTHDEDTPGKALPWDCSPCTTAVCKTLPQCCGAGPAPAWGPACTMAAGTVCKDADGVRWPVGKVWPDALPTADAAASVAAKVLFGAGGAVERVDGVSGLGTSATVSGWACDPEWPGTTVAVQVFDRPREQTGAVMLGQTRADLAVAAPLAREVSAACDALGLSHARHGFELALPANQQGNVFVYAIDTDTDDGPAAPPTLVRNGIVHVPSCAHSEFETGSALAAACSACATSICNDGSHGACCTAGNDWTPACADAANACAAGTTSAAANSRRFAAVATGWLEPTVNGDYLFESALQPSRLFVNGTKVLDWWDGPGTTQGSVHLSAGSRVHLRWDRFQAEPPAAGAGPGLTWRTPGAAGQTTIPASQLYRLSPGGGSGLTATYWPLSGNGGVSAPVRVDSTIDISANTAPPSALPPVKLPTGFGPSYSARWEGEVVAAFSDDYTFYVTGSGTPKLKIDGVDVPFATLNATPPLAAGGCSHNLCELGEKLARTVTGLPACNSCVDKVCTKDPYCCDGGYLSYYSFEPQWDARCVAEVQTECGITCTNTLPTPTSPERRSISTKALQAGVHHTIEFSYDNATADPTIQLAWSSAREAKHAIPTSALFPKTPGPAGAGTGLNLSLFATKMDGGVLKPDLDKPTASGAIADLSAAPPVGQTGTPLLTVLAQAADVAAATPPPPLLDRPRLGDALTSPSTNIKVHGLGGLRDGSVRIRVAEYPATDVLVPVDADGSFTANVELGDYGARTLTLVQRTYPGAVCVPPNPCLESATINWSMTLVKPAAAAPEITAPTDPTHIPDAVPAVVAVKGRSFPGATITIHETGSNGASVSPLSFTVGNSGLIDGKITLTEGSTNPDKGWHRLTFDQGGVQSPPVFVSVGIQPPTLEFPRTGAVLDCTQPDPPRVIKAKGTLPYPTASFPFRIFEETGRQRLREVAKETSFPNPAPGQPITFETTLYNLSYGRHLVYFFQAPEPPAGVPRDEHFRNFASIADTPTSRIEINIRPPRLQDVARVIFPSQQQASVLAGPGTQSCGIPGAQDPPYCAQPNADVNVKIGTRVFTTRADTKGGWFIEAPMAPGWNDVSVSQVVDSEVGGGWQESCPSETLTFGVGTSGTIKVHVPADKAVEATSRQGAVVGYDASAESTVGHAVAIACVPPSGALFPVGRTVVLCTATDKDSGEIALGRFAIDVLDGPPVVRVPAGGIDAEADSRLGAMVDFSGRVSANDAVSGSLPVECVPASPALFVLDTDQTVQCAATDEALQTATASFVVRVRDTTPPALCALPNLTAPATSAAGAVVTYATCASDAVDGATPVSCDRPSGSVFPLGKTTVTCRSIDRHGNRSPASSFTVAVTDTTPPVLKLPGTITAFATSKSGAKVKYTVTATDNVDPAPKVACTPKSETIFPLGKTTVKCTATDTAGNQSIGTFVVRVLVQWGGLLPPVRSDGTSRFTFKQSIAVAFTLAGASADICDLPARLWAAPLDAAGRPGAEIPARRIAGSGNLFEFMTAGHKYLLTMDTRPLGLGAWQLRVDLGDGEVHTVKITLVR